MRKPVFVVANQVQNKPAYIAKKIARGLNQRTNGPVNPHLRSAVYTNVIENSPSIGADETLGPFFFPE